MRIPGVEAKCRGLRIPGGEARWSGYGYRQGEVIRLILQHTFDYFNINPSLTQNNDLFHLIYTCMSTTSYKSC